MKLSVLANLYGKKSLDETLKILTDLGVHTVEIGAGGYPGKAHCNPAELLADEKKFDEFVATFKKYDVDIDAYTPDPGTLIATTVMMTLIPITICVIAGVCINVKRKCR